jgi:hypothetical protein
MYDTTFYFKNKKELRTPPKTTTDQCKTAQSSKRHTFRHNSHHQYDLPYKNAITSFYVFWYSYTKPDNDPLGPKHVADILEETAVVLERAINSPKRQKLLCSLFWVFTRRRADKPSRNAG